MARSSDPGRFERPIIASMFVQRSVVFALALGFLAPTPWALAAPSRPAPRLLASWNVDGTVEALSVGPGGSTVTYAIASNVLARIDTRSGRRDTLFVYRVPPAIPEPLALGPTSNIVASPHGDWIACAANRKLAIVDPRSRRILNVLSVAGTDLGSIACSPEGDRIAGHGQGVPDGITVWDVKTGRQVAWVNAGDGAPMGALAWSPRGDCLAFAGFPSDRVTLWDPHGWARRGAVVAGAKWCISPVFSPDGRRLFALAQGVQLVAWDVKSRRVAWRSAKLRFGGQLGLAISADGRFLLATIEPDTLALFDARTGRLVCRWADAGARGRVAAFCPDRPIVVSAGLRGDLHVWDASAALARGGP